MTLILILGLLGVLDAGYLVCKSAQRQVPICPFGHSCAFVLESRYNRLLFGVKNEVIGFLFYGAVVLGAGAALLGIATIPSVVWSIVVGLAAFASLALLCVQAFVLRAYCSWCIASAIINIILFAAVVVALRVS